MDFGSRGRQGIKFLSPQVKFSRSPVRKRASLVISPDTPEGVAMFFNVLNPGPVGPGNYVQPNTAAPAGNASVGKALPPPAVVVSASPPVQQPDYRKPTVAAGVASYSVKNGNPMAVIFPVQKNNSDAEAELFGATGRGPVAGVIPPAIAVGWNWQKS
jgi:hypothetical protein